MKVGSIIRSCLVWMALWACLADAAPIGTDDAARVGGTYLRARTAVGLPAVVTRRGQIDEYSIEGVKALTSADPNVILAYVLDLHPSGYVVVSPDTDLTPIIAYSFQGAFPAEQPTHPLFHMVTWDMEERLEAITVLPASMKAQNNQLWADYLAGSEQFTSEFAASQQWGPWVTTQWHQGNPFNKYCPCISPQQGGGCAARAIVGCTATAMAQVVNYWKYPGRVRFTDADGYTTSSLQIRIDQDAGVRDFPDFTSLNKLLEHMQYDGDEDEAAALCFACGISVHMDYNDVSGAHATGESFRETFGYTSADRMGHDEDDFYETLHKNMKDGRPALITIYEDNNGEKKGYHSIVTDGYKDTGEYHLNFGWAGAPNSDGWYFLPTGMPRDYDVVDYGVVDIWPGPIALGIRWLCSRQASNGSWYSGDPAVTSFAVLTMLSWGYDESFPPVSKGINYVLSKINPDGSVYNQSHRYTYYTSIATLPLAATHNPDYHDELEKMRNWLVGGQWDEDSFYGNVAEDNPYYGGWGYGNSTRPDLSNTQWALMGLKAADKELGLDADRAYDKCADYFLARCRNADGGSGYTPGDTSIHTMTAASVWSFSLCGRGADAEALGGIQWLSDRYSLTNNDGWGWWSEYYYKVTLAKALTMTHKTKLGTHDWFAELSAKLAEEQSGDGYWPDTGMMGPEMSTCWAIMALQTKTFPPDADLGFWATLESHADLHVYDPLGRHTGVNYTTNSIEENIPGSTLKILDPQGNEVPYNGTTPEDGYKQVFQLTQVIPGSYRVELTGTSDGPYHLTLQGLQDGEVVTTNGYEGDITKDKRLATNATMTSMEGAMTIIYEDLVVMPVLGVDPDKLAIMADPGVTKATSFTVKEIGGEKVMHDVTMYCTDITGPGGTVDGDSVTFDVGDVDVPAGGQQLVNASIPIPATFAGVATGSIVVESTDGGTRAIEVALLSLMPLRDYLEVSIGMPLYDGRTGLYYVNLGVKNLSDKPFGTPLWLVLDSISNSSISLLEADGTTPEGKPYVDVSDELGDGTLSPGETLHTRLVFGMDGRRWTGYLRRFTFNLSVLGVVSDAPTPAIEAEVEIYPKVLNVANRDRISALIRLPKGYSERDIDVSSVTCMGAPAIEGKMTFDGRLMVQFDTGALVGVEPSEAVEFKVEGQLTYGTPFTGADTIKVISRTWGGWLNW